MPLTGVCPGDLGRVVRSAGAAGGWWCVAEFPRGARVFIDAAMAGFYRRR